MTYKPTYNTGKKNEKLHLNAICGSHDLWCGCDEPLKHTINAIFKHAKPTNFTEEEKQQIKICLGEDTADTTGKGDALDTIDEGELTKLFEEDGEETG